LCLTHVVAFNDIQFRRALTYAYDYEWLNKALFYGQYQRLQSYFANSELEAKGPPGPKEMQILQPLLPKLHTVMRQGVLKNWKYPVSDASGFNRNNLLIARQILIKADYRIHDGKLYDSKGQPVEIEFLIHQDGLQRTLMPFVRNLKKLGIVVTLRQVDVPQYLERMRRYDFDMTTSVMPQSLTPGNEQAQLWGSAAADQAGNYNYAGIKNPVIDQVINSVIRAPDRQQLVIRTRVLDRLLRAGYYQIPTYGKGENWLAYWNMYHQPKQKPKLSVGLDYWWIDSKQAQQVSSYLRRQ
jgi:microcin C transport system substrate-binding protein